MPKQSLRQTLHQRDDVSDDDIDDIVAIAQELQDKQLAESEGRASLAEVKAVAAELDIAPEHVEAAIAELGRKRVAAEAEQAAQTQSRALVLNQRRRTARQAARVVSTLVMGLVMVTGGLAMMGRSQVRQADRSAAAAQADLEVALTRQASLAPQLVGLAGADGSGLATMQANVRDAPDIQARMAAADALSTEMARLLGQLPPAASDAEATSRLNLQDELTGSQNRVTAELRRYRDAETQLADERSSLLGGLAVGLGLVD